MFTKGQIIFAILFAIAFVIATTFMYRKDRKTNPNYFKGSYKILLSFILAIGILFLIKIWTQK